MARSKNDETRQLTAATLERVIQRADELSEFLSIYWKDGKQAISKQVKTGLSRAFLKFSEYDLAKYDRNNASVRLRDVLFLSHPKPQDKAQEKLWKRLANNELATPDTWETELSSGADKKETWERLMKEKKLGAMAFIRNLRNMEQVGVDKDAIRKHFKGVDASRLLPFRFITAARHAPQWEPELEALLFSSASARRKLKGHTIILVDISGSMNEAIGSRTEIKRVDAASGIAMIAREMCASAEVFIFGTDVKRVPARRGFALRDVICNAIGGGTMMGNAVSKVDAQEKYDRLIVITDEQTQDTVPSPKNGRGYILNVATEKNGIGYGAWTHVHGWSESVLDYIGTSEG